MENAEEMPNEITLAKIVYTDRPKQIYTVDVDDIRDGLNSTKDPIHFGDVQDFAPAHTYYVKWRNCPATCEETHKHYVYCAARILCLGYDARDLNSRKFRYPNIPYDEQQLSPVSSRSSSQKSFNVDYDVNLEEQDYSELEDESSGSDQEEEEKEEENEKLHSSKSLSRKRKLQLEEAKKSVLRRRSLEHLAKSLESKQSKRSSNGILSNAEQPQHQGDREQAADHVEAANGIVGNGEINDNRQNGNHEELDLAAVGAGANVTVQNGINDEENRQGNARDGRAEEPVPPPRPIFADEPVPQKERRIRYSIVNGDYYVNENLSIDYDTYHQMRLRPYAKRNLFRIDTAALLWTDQEIAMRSLRPNRVQKPIPGLRAYSPRKIDLMHTIVCNWYEDEKGIRMTQKKKDAEMKAIRSCLSDLSNVKRALLFPELVKRDRPLQNEHPNEE